MSRAGLASRSFFVRSSFSPNSCSPIDRRGKSDPLVRPGIFQPVRQGGGAAVIPEMILGEGSVLGISHGCAAPAFRENILFWGESVSFDPVGGRWREPSH